MSVDITDCYGKKCLDCVEFCEHRECGISVIREKQAELSRFNGTNGNTVYIDAMGDCDEAGEDYGDEYDEDGAPVSDANSYLDEIRDAEREGNNWLWLEKLGLIDGETPEEVKKAAYEIVLEFIRILYPMIVKSPQGVQDLFASVLDGERQADRARKASISREAQRKRQNKSVAEISNALGVRKDKEAAILGLTAEEFAAYKVLFIDGCSFRSAAKQLNISVASAYRMKQFLRLKLQKSETHKKANLKKNAKKMTRAEIIAKAIALQTPRLKHAPTERTYKGYVQGALF